jgi:aminoglycoside phosphotransferase family enzyme/predicted kinase
LTRRYQSCEDEVRLNRRLTEEVYLDVLPIVRTPAGCLVGGQGAPIEWATVMRRLPAAGMLEPLLRAGTVPPLLADRLAARLLPFHRTCAPVCGRSPATAAAATRIVTDNLDELSPFRAAPLGPVQLQLVAAAMRQFLVEHDDLLQQRAAAGWIREGHGDLRAEHICLEPNGVMQIFDCVEFNRDLRCADVASDLAFLLMDLTRLGAPQVAATLFARYREAGLVRPTDLLRWYWAHRALVRAKVACFGVATASPGRAHQLTSEAADYLDLASTATLTVRPALIVMTGLSGTGKSTVARRLARALGARRFASDVVRKALAGFDGSAPAAWGKGIYRPELTRATYDQLFALAEDRLAMGEPVVLDATFLDPDQRAAAAAAASRHNVPLVLVETTCDEATVATRLAARTKHGQAVSDASFATYLRQRAAITASPPSVPPGAMHIRSDTEGPLPISLEGVWAALARQELVQPNVPSGQPVLSEGRSSAASLAAVLPPPQAQFEGVSVWVLGLVLPWRWRTRAARGPAEASTSAAVTRPPSWPTLRWLPAMAHADDWNE